VAGAGTLVGRGYVSIRPEFEGDWSRQASARASSAGSSAGSGFSKAFGSGIKGIGALAGVAVAGNLSGVAAASAALAPALAMAGTAAAALKLGMSGVGEAFKAAFADTSGEAKAAASATRAVEGAQRGLASAQRALADARVQAAERVREAQRAVADAERGVAEAVEQSAQRQRDAQVQVRDAERDLRDAQSDARDAQVSLTDARRDAVRTLEDMNQRLAESQLDEREAVLRLKQAEDELKAAQRKPGTKPEDLARLQLAYDRASLNLKEQRRDTARLADDTKKANKSGIEGSTQVVAAQKRIADAGQTVGDRQRALAKAQENVRRTGVEGARAVADAQRDLADAQSGVDKARADGQRQVADAQRAVGDAARAVADAQAAAAAQTNAFDEAMAKLAPNARSFVTAVKGLAPAWSAMKLGVQNRLFEGMDVAVTGLANRTIPILQRQLTATAGTWNAMGKSAISAIDSMAKSGMLEKIMEGANRSFAQFKDTPGQLVTAFGQLSLAAQPAFEQLMGQFAGAIKSFTDGIAASFASGGLQEAINTAFGILSQFGTLLGNALGAVMQILKAASDAGASIIASLSAVFAELKRIFAAPEMQAALRTLFTSVAQIVGAIVPVIGAIVQAIVPLVAAVLPAIAAIAKVLGPVLAQLATTLGAALMPIITALMPVVQQVGIALVRVVQAVMPLLTPIAELITTVVSALAPALTPIIAAIVAFVRVLVGPLSALFTALNPALQLLASLVTTVFQALTPILGPLITLIGQAATLLVGLFATALNAVLRAIQPLIPIGMRLLESVIGALTPILPILGTALTAVAGALAALLVPVTEVWSSLAQQLGPVIAQMVPIISQLAATLTTGLAAILPPLTSALMILFRAFSPLFPLITEILGIVVGLGASILRALLPPLMGLIKAAVGLLVALSPILPPIAKLIGLVVKLAVGVLSFLLPPLVKLVGFFVGALARALGVVIGWIAGLINIIAKVVSWVLTKLAPAFTWLNARVIQPVWRAIQAVIKWAWENVIQPIWRSITNWIRATLGPVMSWLGNRVSVVWQGIRIAIANTWERWIKPTFERLRRAVALVADSFRLAKDAIGRQWDKIRALTRGPIKWVIDIVYNRGIVGMWNAASSVLPLTKLKPFKFADGGRTEGGVPGKDSIPILAMADEFIVKRDSARKIGFGALEYMNRTGSVPGFAAGGRVGETRGAHGGIGDWFGGQIKRIGGLLGNAKDWVLGGIHKAASLAAKPIRDLIGKIPGADGGFGKLVKSLPTAVLNQALAAIKGGEDGQLSAGGQWVKPVDAKYGTRFGVAGRMWSSGRHTGLDFPAALGSAVKAVAAGQITGAKSGGPYGNHLVVNHGGGLQSLYAHLSQMIRTSGAVNGGDLIGKVGATGNVTGPHLHLEARLNGRPVDPMTYLTGGGNVTGGGKGVERWRGTVLKALGLVGQPASMAGITLRRMNQESGGDPNIVNRWDSNWKAGYPSVGLMQVIGPTFRAFAGQFKGTGPFSYGVSTNPLANIYASMRYALSTYGGLSKAYGRPGGYAAGGTPRPGEWAWAGERGPELIRFGSPSTVYSHRDSMALAAGGSGRGVTIGGIKVYVGDREITDIARAEVHSVTGQLVQVINSRGGG
jgi:phage-related protein